MLECIESILQPQNLEILGQILVLDNASSDGSASLPIADQRLKVIHNKQNMGFAYACNQGISESNSSYIVMLNPDTVLLPNTLSQSFQFMEANQEADILGCTQLDESGNIRPSVSRFPSPARFFYDSCGLSKLLPTVFKPATLMTDWDHKTSAFVDQIMGSYMFIRRSVFDKIGLFDTRFFVYYEELDLSRRLSLAGGKSYYNHEIRLIHKGEGTTRNVKGYRLFLNLNSRLFYANKHFGRAGYRATAFNTLFVEFATRILISIIKGHLGDVRETIKGYKLLWKSRL